MENLKEIKVQEVGGRYGRSRKGCYMDSWHLSFTMLHAAASPQRMSINLVPMSQGWWSVRLCGLVTTAMITLFGEIRDSGSICFTGRFKANFGVCSFIESYQINILREVKMQFSLNCSEKGRKGTKLSQTITASWSSTGSWSSSNSLIGSKQTNSPLEVSTWLFI